MKKIVTALALATLVASPAFAAKRQAQAPNGQAAGYEAYGFAGPAAVYGVDGRYLGQDPDPNVRLQLHQDEGQSNNY